MAARKAAVKQDAPAANPEAKAKAKAKDKAKADRPAKASPSGPAQVKSWSAGKAGSATLDGTALAGVVKPRLLRQAVRLYEANQRQGTHCTKTRGETNFTTRKPYKQKGTGGARRGDFNSPLLRKGGVIFGPRPRDYRQTLPRRALREALRSALAGKLRDGEVVQLARQGFDKPSTKAATLALAGLGCTGRACVVVPEHDVNLWKSFRNIAGCSVTRAADLNALDVLLHRHVVFVDGAWDKVVERLNGGAS